MMPCDTVQWVKIDENVQENIKSKTDCESCGRIKMMIRHNRNFLQSSSCSVEKTEQNGEEYESQADAALGQSNARAASRGAQYKGSSREGRQASVTLQLTCWITTSKSLHKTKTNSWALISRGCCKNWGKIKPIRRLLRGP